MIFSSRIAKLHNQFALLRSINSAANCRRYSIIINDNIERRDILKSNKNLAQTYRLTSIEERAFRFVSTSPGVLAQTKVMKGEGDQGLNLDYEDILKAQKDENVLIVDVREDAEIQETGKLPGSIHVSMGEVADVFNNYSDKAFSDKFGKSKPTKDTKIIFSCRSGKRSAMVQEAMIKLGYGKSYNYTGGWLDWESKQSPTA